MLRVCEASLRNNKLLLRGFPEKVTTTTTRSGSMHMQDGEEPGVFLSSVGKTEKEFVVEDVENLKTINEIVAIAINSNSSKGPSISGVVSRKMKRDSVSKSTMGNLQAQGYKIIDSNILQSMLNEVGRCTSGGEQKLQFRENVNKRIGMCEYLVLFRPLAEHSYQSYLKYLEKKLISDGERSMLNS